MSTLAKLVSLFCGQGMSHILEIYNDGVVKPAADHIVLIDFGGNKSVGDDAVDYVVEKLKAQTTPRIDLMVISHQDNDHLYLLTPLREKLEAEDVEFELGGLYLGGLNWSGASRKTVADFIAAAKGNTLTVSMEPYRSDYAGKGKRSDLGSLTAFGDVTLRVAMAQLKVSSSGTDIIRNGSSAVIVIENGQKSIVLPGDSTYETLDKINELYLAWVGSKSLIPTVAALEVPHHGALRTSVENYVASSTTDDFNFSIIQEFSDNLAAQEIFASAGMRNTHGHPVKEVLDVFNAGLAATPDDVEYVAFVFDNKSVERRSRFTNFSEKIAKRTTILRMSDDYARYWPTNIEVTLHRSVAAGAAVRNSRTLTEILAEQGLGPGAAGGPPTVYAPPPTEAERAGAAAAG